MRSKWTRGHGDHQHAPVEMRFVDMFMTALGSLLFVILLLVYLLPKTLQAPAQDKPENVDRAPAESQLRQEMERQAETQEMEQQIRELRKAVASLDTENQKLRDQLHQQGTPPQSNVSGTEDKDIVKRWFNILLLTEGCKSAEEPVLYVRWEGSLEDPLTGKPIPDAVHFDASKVKNRTYVTGQSYFDIGHEPPIIMSTEVHKFSSFGELKKNGFHMKLFSGVQRVAGSWSIYVGFKDPQAQSNTDCTVYPIYLSSKDLVRADKIIMNLQRPFAWLRRFKMDSNGTTDLGQHPSENEAFKRELEIFSLAQSEILCKKKGLCNTVDAHYASIALPRFSAGPIWRSNLTFGESGYAQLTGLTSEQCHGACLKHARCQAIEFSKKLRQCKLFENGTIEPQESDGDERTEIAFVDGISCNMMFICYDGFDLPQGDLKSWNELKIAANVDHSACEAQCGADPACKGYTYNKRHRRCFLKGDITSLVVNGTAVSGVRARLKQPARYR